MELKIMSVHEHGSASKEYVWIEVLEDCDLDHYAVADTTYTSERTISNKLRHFYWFKKKQVKAGQRIVLRTGVGKDDSYKSEKGYTVHRFYWGLKSAVWNDDGDAALLLRLDTWKAKRA